MEGSKNQNKVWISGKIAILPLDGARKVKYTSVQKSSHLRSTDTETGIFSSTPKDSVPSGNFQGDYVTDPLFPLKLSILELLKFSVLCLHSLTGCVSVSACVCVETRG